MIELIAVIILLFSFVGIVLFFYRKIPVLAQYYPENSENISLMPSLIKKLKDNVFIDSKEDLLLKVLSKSRILVLKTEHKIVCWLNALRQKSVEKEKCFKGNYWEKIKIKKRGRKLNAKKNEDKINIDL